jgi:hypothetical protein
LPKTPLTQNIWEKPFLKTDACWSDDYSVCAIVEASHKLAVSIKDKG